MLISQPSKVENWAFWYLSVVPVLFRHSLKEQEEQRVANLDHIFGKEPIRIVTPSTDSEVATSSLGRMLFDAQKARYWLINTGQSRVSDLTWFHMLLVLMNILSTRGVFEQGACLDALISIMLDSSANQMVDIVPSLCLKFPLPLNEDFEACNGIEEVAILIKDKQVEENLRYFSAQALVFPLLIPAFFMVS
ncbi:hypothetical protein RHMOL_Rhmol07G0105100 [Rhododendron molle]|uniref:Uncharacterized protein n=1 Tax=Rhododendron molle TaxID=49168 RepID=A0ACC0MZ42_RHOML|nr:hypothetical protein RHMOL_Rhmol07G0105100 [Rhododendron molle]